jgi:hypothetical protein
MITPEFIFAGKSTFTLEVPSEFKTKYLTKDHYTFRLIKKDDVFFAQLLTGPDNTSNYSYIGLVSNGELLHTKKSFVSKDSLAFRFLSRILYNAKQGTLEEVEKKGFVLHHEGRCGRCGRKLTTPESCDLGIGPECFSRMAA